MLMRQRWLPNTPRPITATILVVCVIHNHRTSLGSSNRVAHGVLLLNAANQHMCWTRVGKFTGSLLIGSLHATDVPIRQYPNLHLPSSNHSRKHSSMHYRKCLSKIISHLLHRLTATSNMAHSGILSLSTLQHDFSSSWIVDSGASDHMTGSFNLFTTFRYSACCK